MLAATLFSFSQLFQDGDYPGPALLGMLLAAGIAMSARRVGLGAVLTFGASLAGLTWYTSFLFQTDRTLYGLPTPASVEGVGRLIVRARELAQVDFAPVPVRPGYVVLAVIGFWVATTVAEVATFRWRNPLLASVPSIGLFSVVMVVGTGAGAPLYITLFLGALFTYWGLEASHRLRSWGRWVPTWANHEEEPESITPNIARKMGATCLAVTLLSPLFLPAIEDGLLSWRSGMGSGEGGSGGGRIDPLVSIAPSVVNQSDTTLFRVRAERGRYWRLVSLTNFNGETWMPLGEGFVAADGGVINPAFGAPAPAATRDFEQEILLEGLQGRYLPAAVQPREIRLGNHPDRADDLQFHASTGDLAIDGEISGRISYGVVSGVPDVDYEELRNADIGYGGTGYTALPRALTPEVSRLLSEWVQGAETPFERLVAIQNNLRSNEFTYNLSVDDADEGSQQASTDALTRFLTQTKEGFCQQFATAFAVLSRELGYPTRVAVGFLPGEASLEREGEWIVKGTDAHAWPEVYFDQIGWVAFEPTPRADGRIAFAPDYTYRTRSGDVSLGLDGGLGRPRERGDPTLDARALNDPGDTGLSPLQLRALIEGSETEIPPEDEDAPWKRTFARLAIVLIALVIVYLTVVPTLKAYALKRRRRRASSDRDRVIAAYDEFLLDAAELASPRRTAESARAYARRLSETRGVAETSTLRLAVVYEAAQYSPMVVAADDAEVARKLGHELRGQLWANASWTERARRLFSTGSMGAARTEGVVVRPLKPAA